MKLWNHEEVGGQVHQHEYGSQDGTSDILLGAASWEQDTLHFTFQIKFTFVFCSKSKADVFGIGLIGNVCGPCRHFSPGGGVFRSPFLPTWWSWKAPWGRSWELYFVHLAIQKGRSRMRTRSRDVTTGICSHASQHRPWTWASMWLQSHQPIWPTSMGEVSQILVSFSLFSGLIQPKLVAFFTSAAWSGQRRNRSVDLIPWSHQVHPPSPLEQSFNAQEPMWAVPPQNMLRRRIWESNFELEVEQTLSLKLNMLLLLCWFLLCVFFVCKRIV